MDAGHTLPRFNHTGISHPAAPSTASPPDADSRVGDDSPPTEGAIAMNRFSTVLVSAGVSVGVALIKTKTPGPPQAGDRGFTPSEWKLCALERLAVLIWINGAGVTPASKLLMELKGQNEVVIIGE